jgi:hypothetical protein
MLSPISAQAAHGWSVSGGPHAILDPFEHLREERV